MTTLDRRVAGMSWSEISKRFSALTSRMDTAHGRFPDLDQAWKHGLAELRAKEIALADTPLFLILGLPNTASVHAMMRASRLNLGVKPTEDNFNPLLWFSAEKDGHTVIFLFLTACCQTSRLSSGYKLNCEPVQSDAPDDDSAALETIQNVNMASDFISIENLQPVDNPGAQSGGSGHSPSASQKPVPIPQMAESSSNDTAVKALGDLLKESGTTDFLVVKRIFDEDVARIKERLKYVCHLLRVERQPRCAFNGIMATVPFNLLMVNGDEQGRVLGTATHEDLQIITNETGVCAHVIAMVHGLDADEDFRVFVKRMREFQSAADVHRRLGKGVNPWSMGSENDQELVKAAAHAACDAFQRTIYKFFSATQSLKKIDNGQLYRFLAKIRGKVRGNLVSWLVNALVSHDRGNWKEQNNNRLPQLAGCYFVAAQPASDDVSEKERFFAHVPGVFDRLMFDLPDKIEWTPEAVAKNRTYLVWANSLCVLFFALLILAVGLICFKIGTPG